MAPAPARIGLALLGASLLLGTVGPARARGGAPHLFWIGSDDRSALAPLAREGVAPVRILPGFALAWGPETSRESIRARGFEARDLGERRPDCSYAVVHSGGPHGRAATDLEAIARVLMRDRSIAIVETPRARFEELARGWEILPIPDRPIRFRPAMALQGIAPGGIEPDPTIAETIARVDVDTLRAVAQHLQDYGTRKSFDPQCFAAGDWIADRFRALGLPEVTLFDFNAWADNVVAVQPGLLAPEEIYVIGGHYDSTASGDVAPGADDNASGTTAVLEAARLLARSELEATVVYIAFAGEEQGLVGSEAWASWAAAQGFDIRGMVNLDMIGYRAASDPGDLDLISEPATSSALRDLAFQVGAAYLPDYPMVDGFLSGGNSDQQSFWDQGYAALLFHEASGYRNPYYHTANDVIGPSLNDFDFMRKNVQVAVALLATLARPLRVRISHTPLPDPPSDAPSYVIEAEILANAPLWEDSLLVRYRVDDGDFTQVRMEPSGGSRYAATIPARPAGARIDYYIYARDVEGRTGLDPVSAPARLHSFVVGLETRFVDGFEEDAGWIVGAPEDDATSGLWERAVSAGNEAQPLLDATGDSSGFCFVTGNGGAVGENDIDGGRTTLTSPRVDLAGTVGVRLAYARWFVDETFPDDTLRVFLSNDDGATWTLLESVGETAREWRSARFENLERLLPVTDRMRLRFVAADQGNASLVEAAVDEIAWMAAVPAPQPPVLSNRSRIVAAGPVPARDRMTITYDLLEDLPVRLAAYDAGGRLVARLERGSPGVGRHVFAWDGRDEAGERVPSGLYFVHLSVRGEPAGTRSVVFVR